MKIVMAMPPWRPSEVFTGNFGMFVGGTWHPLGILSVAAALREAGHDVTLLDGAFYTQEEMVRKIADMDPGFVGFYLTTFLWRNANSIAEQLKREMPDLLIVVGGPLASGWRDRVLRETDLFDAVTFGEGEETAADLADALTYGRDLSTVRSIAYREDGEVKKTRVRPPLADLDALPFPARDLLGDVKKYVPPLGTYKRLPAMYMYTSRGCNGQCIFCWQLNAEGDIRTQSAERVLAELDHIYETYKLKEIRFFDDNFTYDKERIHKILDGIIERDYDLTFYASSRVDDVDEGILEKMGRAGFWGIMFGIEAGTQEDLDALGKGVTVEQNRKAVEWAHRAGLLTVTPFIFGIPGQTPESARKAIDFAIEIDSDIVNFHSLTPFPGAELYEHVEKYGSVASDDVSDYTFEGIAFVPKTMTREEIQDLRAEGFRRFYRRPRYMWKRLKMIRGWTDIKVLVAGGIAFLMTILFKKEFTPHGTQV